MRVSRLFTSARSIVTAAAVAAFASGAFAQGNLATLPGLTQVQQPTAAAINTACVELGQASITPDPNGTPQQRLFYSCRAMVQSANQLAGSGATGSSLNISNEQLRRAVEAIAPVQMAAQKQVNNESARVNLVNARLLDLRSGRQGFSVSMNGMEVRTKTASNSGTTDVAGTGGGAAADTPLGGPLGGFVNFAYNWGKVDQTDLQEPYKYDNYSVIAGVDYRFSPALVLGAAVSYSDTNSDFEQSLGNVKARTTSIVGYGTYYINEWYVDGFLSWGDVRYDSTRNIIIPSNNPGVPAFNTSATASPKGDEWSGSIGLGRSFSKGGVTFAPVARLTYIHVKNKSFTENEPNNGLGLAVNDRSITSFQSALGGRVSTAVSTASGVFNPYVSAQWVHEFRNNQSSIISKYVNDPFNNVFVIPTARPTRDYGILGVGSTATFPNDWSAFAQFAAAVGLRDQTNYGIVVGVRKQF